MVLVQLLQRQADTISVLDGTQAKGESLTTIIIIIIIIIILTYVD